MKLSLPRSYRDPDRALRIAEQVLRDDSTWASQVTLPEVLIDAWAEGSLVYFAHAASESPSDSGLLVSLVDVGRRVILALRFVGFDGEGKLQDVSTRYEAAEFGRVVSRTKEFVFH